MKTLYVCVDTSGSVGNDVIVRMTDNILNLLEYIDEEYILPQVDGYDSMSKYGLSEEDYYDPEKQSIVEDYLLEMWSLVIKKTQYEDTQTCNTRTKSRKKVAVSEREQVNSDLYDLGIPMAYDDELWPSDHLRAQMTGQL